jgi:hypothetical protein
MKALTLTQPWASLVAIGAKQVETRSWSTRYRGLLAIHAAKMFTEDDFDLIKMPPFCNAMESILDLTNERKVYGLPLGCVIAICELVEITPIGKVFYISDQERAFGNYTPGRWAWILDDAVMLPKPLPARGMQGLWNWDEAGLEAQ